MNIAFYCSGKASRFFKFYEKYQYDEFPTKLIFYDGSESTFCGSVNNINRSIKVISFDTKFYKPKSKELSTALSNDLLNELLANNIDYLFCFGDKILKGDILLKFNNRIINFHPSLLPSFPGLMAIDQALKSGVKILGNTAHFIDSGIDTGQIIMQTAIPRSQFKDYEDVLKLQIDMLASIWKMIKTNTLIDSINEESTENKSETETTLFCK